VRYLGLTGPGITIKVPYTYEIKCIKVNNIKNWRITITLDLEKECMKK